MKKLLVIVFSLCTLAYISSNAVYADSIMTMSGYLHNNNGSPIEDGVYDFKVTFWDGRSTKNETNSMANWEEIHAVIFTPNSSGYFSIEIGSKTTINSDLIDTYPFLQVEIRDLTSDGEYEILDPRTDNDDIDRLDFVEDSVFFKDNVFKVQQSNQLKSDISIQFGENLEAFIKYNTINNTFNISKSVAINGNLTVNGLINGRDISSDGAILDTINTTEKIVDAINSSNLQISANNIDFSDLENTTYRYSFDLNKTEDYDQEGDMIQLINGEISINEDEIINIFASYSEGEKFAYTPIDGDFCPADQLFYIASYSNARVYAINPDTKQIVHEIGVNGYGNGAISNVHNVDISTDGLAMAITSTSHYVSVWKRDSIENNWHFAFDIGTPASYDNVSDGSKLRTPYSAVIRNSDKHIFVGNYYGVTKDFHSYSTGYGGVIEYDENGNFISIPLHYGSKGGNGTIKYGEAHYVYGLAFDNDENLWVSTADNQIGRFDSTSWELQKTISSNEITGDYIDSPHKIELLGEDKIITRNNQLNQVQIWSIDGKLLNSFGYNEHDDSILAFITLYGFLVDEDENIYVMNYTNNNIQKVTYDKINNSSRVIFPIISLNNARELERLLVSKKKIGNFNNISFQYRLDEEGDWIDIPEDYDLSDIDFNEKNIQLSAVFTAELKSNAIYSSDIINGVQIEYSVY